MQANYYQMASNNLYHKDKKEQYSIVLERVNNRNKFYMLLYKLFAVCDLKGLNHYAELKPTCTDLRRDGFKVKINNGKVFVFCKECYEKIKKETKK